jgi:hypothetical protein
MPIPFKCTGCDKAFRVADELAGRKTKCPACATVLVVPDGAIAARPMRKPAPLPPPVEDDYDVVEEEDEAPAKKKAAPVKAKAKAPSRREEEDEDDQPRRRGARKEEPLEEVLEEVEGDEEEDEEDEPTPKKRGKKKPAKKKGGSGLVIGLLVGGLVAVMLLCAGGVGVAAWVWGPMLWGGASAPLTYAPDNCVMVANVRWDDLRNSAAWKSIERENPDMQKSMNKSELNGILQKDVVQFVMMGGGGSATLGNFVGYVKTKQPMTPDDLKAAAPKGTEFKESQAGSYKVYESKGHTFCLLDSRTALLGDDAQTLRTVITRNKKPTFTPEMERALADMNWSKAVAAAGSVKSWPGMNAGPGVPGPKGGPGVPPGPPGGPGVPPGPPAGGGMPNYFEGVEAFTLNVDITADVKATLVVQCKDAKSAEDLRKLADGGITAAKNGPGVDSDTKDFLNALKFANVGPKLTAELIIRGDTIAKATKQQQQRIPGGFPGF